MSLPDPSPDSSRNWLWSYLLFCILVAFLVHGEAYHTFGPGYVFSIFFLSILSKNSVCLEQEVSQPELIMLSGLQVSFSIYSFHLIHFSQPVIKDSSSFNWIFLLFSVKLELRHAVSWCYRHLLRHQAYAGAIYHWKRYSTSSLEPHTKFLVSVSSQRYRFTNYKEESNLSGGEHPECKRWVSYSSHTHTHMHTYICGGGRYVYSRERKRREREMKGWRKMEREERKGRAGTASQSLGNDRSSM